MTICLLKLIGLSLFGSSARNDRLAESDIDLIVISQDFEQMSFPERFLVLQKNWKQKIDLEAFGFTPGEYEKLKDKSIILQEATEYGIRIKTSILQKTCIPSF